MISGVHLKGSEKDIGLEVGRNCKEVEKKL